MSDVMLVNSKFDHNLYKSNEHCRQSLLRSGETRYSFRCPDYDQPSCHAFGHLFQRLTHIFFSSGEFIRKEIHVMSYRGKKSLC